MRLSFSLFFLLFFSAFSYSQPAKPLAMMGDQVITTDDFIMKWETTPQPGRELEGPMTESKEKLLKTMVAEKVLAAYARQLRLDTLYAIRRMIRSMEEISVRDQFFKADIQSKVSVTPAMLAEAEARAHEFRHIRFVFHPDYDSALFLYSRLKLGASFDSLLATRPESAEQPRPMQITFGSLEKPVEDAVYDTPVGGYTRPVRRPEGFFVFRVERIEPTPVVADKEKAIWKRKLDDMVHIREADTYYLEFMKTFFKGKEVATDGRLFRVLNRKLYEKLMPRMKSQTEKKRSPVSLSDGDVAAIERELGPDTLAMNLIKYATAPVKVRDFLWDLQFRGWNVITSDPERFKGEFGSITEIIARDAVLNHEAYRRGYASHPEVVKRLRDFSDYFLAERVKGRVADTIDVSEQEIRAQYEKESLKTADTVLVNAIEIQVEKAEQIPEILEAHRLGRSFSDLFRQYNQNPGLKHPDGETGWFLPSQRGGVGKDLAARRLMEILGPVKTGRYISLIQLIGKKKLGGVKPVEPEPYETVKADMAAKAWDEKFVQRLNGITVREARKQGLTMDLDALKTVKVTAVNMAAFQQMGFGGKVLVVPYTANYDEWYPDWKGKDPAP